MCLSELILQIVLVRSLYGGSSFGWNVGHCTFIKGASTAVSYISSLSPFGVQTNLDLNAQRSKYTLCTSNPQSLRFLAVLAAINPPLVSNGCHRHFRISEVSSFLDTLWPLTTETSTVSHSCNVFYSFIELGSLQPSSAGPQLHMCTWGPD